jgi:hypothetical protein
MPLFRRKETPPEWSTFMTPEEWDGFERTVRDALADREWSGEPRTGTIRIGELTANLYNLAQICNLAPREEWAQLAREHFGATLQPGPDVEDVEASREAVKARLLSDDFFRQADREFSTRRLAEGLVLALALDLPDRVVMVPREDVLKWGDEDELYGLALARTRQEPGLQLDRHDVQVNDDGDTAPLFALYGDSFFTATHVLWAAEWDPPASPHGTLVAVPTRHLALAHPIRDDRTLGMIGPLLELAHKYEHAGPGSISPQLFWLLDGALHPFNAWIDADGAHVAPDEAFTDMLGRLVE